MARVHDANVRRIAQDIASLKQDMRVVKNRKPGLAYSSIEDGAIREYDKDGVLVSQTGKQPDGTHNHVVVNGPKPPKPAGFSAAAQPGLIELRWNGKFERDAVSPLDLKHVAGYVVASGEFLELSDQAGVMTGELGDNIQVQAVPGAYHVYFVTWSLAGKFSDAAGPVPVMVTAPADPIKIQGVLDDMNEKYDGVITEAGKLGNRLDQAEQDLTEHDQRLGAADQRISDAFVEIGQTDSKAQGAADAAAAAQADADTAKSDADAAQQQALQAAGIANAKGEVIYQATAPTGSRASKANLWIRASDNKPHTYDDAAGRWVAVTDQAALDAAEAAAAAQSKADAAAQAAANAQAAAGSAQQTADGALTMAGSRTSVFYSTKAPSGQGDHEGALWRQWDENKNVIGRWIWDGSSWVKDKLSSDVIDNLDVGKLTVGSGMIADLVAQHIAGATAAFQEVDIKNLFVTTGTFAESVINKLWADVVMSRKITTQMLAIGDFNNYVATGLGVNNESIDWAEGLAPDFEDVPPGISHSFKSSVGQGTKRSTASKFDVNPGEEFVFEVWIKADKPGSRIFIEIRDQDGAHGVTSTRLSEDDIFVGDATYPVGNATVPTTWTRWRARCIPKTGVRQLYVSSIYFNHPNGAERNAQVWLAGLSFRKRFGGEVVLDGSMTAEKVAANAIKAYHADFDSFFADNGFVSQLRSKGIILVDSTGAETVNLTGEGENFITIRDGATGEDLATIDDEGGVTAQNLAVTGEVRADGAVILGGEPLSGTHAGPDSGATILGRDLIGAAFQESVNLHPNMTEDNAWLTMAPHGMKLNAWNDRTDNLGSDGRWGWASGENRMMLTATMEAWHGRQYMLTYRTPSIRPTGSSNNNNLGAALVRYASGTGVVNAGKGSVVPGTQFYLDGGGEYTQAAVTTLLRCPEDIPAGKIMFGVEVYTYVGRTAQSTNTAGSRRWELSVVDLGMRLSSNSGQMVNLRTGGVEPPTPDPTPQPNPVREYTATVSADWWQAYTGDGAQATHSTYNGRAAQGRSPHVPGNGVMRGLVGFPSQASRLSGATVKKIEAYVYADKWHYAAGGTAVLGTHSQGGKPGSWPATTTDVKRQKMKRGQGMWITLPSSVHAGFKSGNLRGISFYPPGGSSSAEYYGLFIGNKTKLRLTYTK